MKTASDGSSTVDAAASGDDLKRGSIIYFDSHSANVTYSATSGGKVHLGTTGWAAGTPPGASASEHFDDSLTGSSKGATAVPDEGYEFLYWLDLVSGQVASTNLYFAPKRPEEGWPSSWAFSAVFEPVVYVVVLNPNGGTFADGDGSDSEKRIEVTIGSDCILPKNGDAISLGRAGYAFVGWGLSANSAASDGLIADGQTLLAPWMEEHAPEVVLFAQWKFNQVAITYRAGQGGSVRLNNRVSSKGASYLQEVLDASTGERIGESSETGPSGASASSLDRYHFAGWSAQGAKASLSQAESSSAVLGADTVTRLSLYADEGSDAGAYHPLTLAASFEPNTYTINYSANGGSGSIDSASLTYGSAIATPSEGVSRAGYSLSGWNLSADGSGTSLAAGAELNSGTVNHLVAAGELQDAHTASATLYAQWVKDEAEQVGGTVTATPAGTNDGGDTAQYVAVAENAFEALFASGPAEVAGVLVREAVGAVEAIAENLQSDLREKEAGQGVEGLLAAGGDNPKRREDPSITGPVVIRESYAGSSSGSGEGGGGMFAQLMSPEGVQEAGTTVAAVAAVGAVASLVGVGVSVAGAAMVGAATIGTAGALGLSTAADLAADLAVNATGSAGGAGAAGAQGASGAANGAKRRKRDESDDEE